MRHVVVTEGKLIVGVLRVNTALRRASQDGRSSVAMRDIASREFVIVREDDIVHDVIWRIWRRQAIMALVVRGRGVPHAADVAGVITKEHVADSVANSIRVYPSRD
jgi:CIC family chloride channel protein